MGACKSKTKEVHQHKSQTVKTNLKNDEIKAGSLAEKKIVVPSENLGANVTGGQVIKGQVPK
jgi:hypothetical protein